MFLVFVYDTLSVVCHTDAYICLLYTSTSTHQAGFGNGCALGTFAYAVATFGLHITDNCIGHCNDRVETCPCIGKVFAQGCHLEVGELGSSPATEVIVGTVTAQRHDRCV